MGNVVFPAISVDAQDRSYTRPVLIVILILAAVLRFSFLIELQANPMPAMVSLDPAFDQYNYVTMAQDIVRHQWVGSQHPGHSPVYSYVIASLFNIFGNDMNVVFAFQIVLGVLAVYVLYRCAVLLFQNKNLALMTAGMAAVYSPFIFYECALLRESMIAYVNVMALYFFLLALRKGKSRNYFFAGMTTALSLILRAGILPVFVLGYLVVLEEHWKKKWKRVLWVLAGMVIVIAPLTIRNYCSGFKALTETSGPTLFWLGNSFDSPGIGLTYTDTQKKLTAETQGRIGPILKVLGREVFLHPLEYLGLWSRKFKMLFNGFEIPANLSYDLFKEQSVILKIAFLNFTLISPLALLGLLLFFRKYPFIGILYSFVFALTVFVFIFHIQSRYRLAFIPFYILAAGYSLFWLGQMLQRKLYRPLSLASALLLLVFLFTFPDKGIMQRYFNGGVRGIDYSNMASAYLFRIENQNLTKTQRRQHLEKAIFYYDKALPHLFNQQKVAVYITQAMVYLDLRMRVHALDALAKALEIDPQNLIAHREYQRLVASRF